MLEVGLAVDRQGYPCYLRPTIQRGDIGVLNRRCTETRFDCGLEAWVRYHVLYPHIPTRPFLFWHKQYTKQGITHVDQTCMSKPSVEVSHVEPKSGLEVEV